MKFLVVFAVALACAAADVSHLTAESNAEVLRSLYDISPDGAFSYAYDTSNGISAQANGEVKNPNSENPTLSIQGGVRYTSADGVPVELTYVADEGGYQPQGSHLPVAPPIPEAIARSLAYIAAHPPKPEGGRSAAAAAILG